MPVKIASVPLNIYLYFILFQYYFMLFIFISSYCICIVDVASQDEGWVVRRLVDRTREQSAGASKLQ